MKIAKNYVLVIISVIILYENVLGTEIMNEKNRKSHDNQVFLRPRVADLNSQMKVIKPFLERPFLPQEVPKLNSEPKRTLFDESNMKKAILLPSNRNENLEEKPMMYSTVIDNHSTAVVHPVPQPINYALQKTTADAFSVSHSEFEGSTEKLNPGAYSIPIKIDGRPSNDPTLSQYETPNFIHKSEKTGQEESHDNNTNIETQMQQNVQKDIETFVAQFDNAKDKAERTQILIGGKHRLAEESKLLSVQVENEMKELLYAKEIATKLNSLVEKYQRKLTKNNLSKLKLADEVTIKDILRNKLQRELQGFRTSPAEYKELEIVNPSDIAEIIKNIKQKMGE